MPMTVFFRFGVLHVCLVAGISVSALSAKLVFGHLKLNWCGTATKNIQSGLVVAGLVVAHIHVFM